MVISSASSVIPAQLAFNNSANQGALAPGKNGSNSLSEASRPVTKAESSKEAQNNNSDQSDKEQQAVIAELSKLDREVRAHEQAHASVGGSYAGAPSLSYQRGPDGRLYAVSGEVSIDVSPVPNDPQATLEKALVIQRAALAPIDPSAADRRIAAKAVAIAGQARAELVIENTDESEPPMASSEKTELSSISGEDDSDRPANLEQRLISSGAISSDLTQGSILDLQA